MENLVADFDCKWTFGKATGYVHIEELRESAGRISFALLVLELDVVAEEFKDLVPDLLLLRLEQAEESVLTS